MKFYVSTDWSDGVPRAVGCFTTDEGTRLDRSELEKLGRLFLAAPELLRGCQAAAAYLIDPASEHKINRDEAARIILAAIAKAEGRAE